LPDYDRQHQLNCAWFDELINDYFKAPLKDIDKSNVLLEEFRNVVYWDLLIVIKKIGGGHLEKANIALGWDSALNCPRVELAESGAVIDGLNDNQGLKQFIKSALNKVYRYQGEFIFEENIPF